MTVAEYEVKIVERDGTFVRTIKGANVESVEEELNGHGSATWSFPKYDPPGYAGQAADIRTLDREVQIWRNGSIIFWGCIVAGSSGGGQGNVSMTSPGVSWYFTRRNIDKTRHNYLTNPQFESGTTGWSATATTASIVTSRRRLGAQSLRLVQATTGADAFEQQNVSMTAGPIGLLVDVAAWFFIESWSGPALESRGLFVEGDIAGVVKQVAFDTIDASTPVGSWQRAETTVWIPPNQTWNVNIRLYSPNGTIEWDAAEVVVMESLASDYAGVGTDIASLAGEIVDFIQDPANDKSDLHIGTAITLAGVVIQRAWQFTEHTAAMSAIEELVTWGLDWSIEITATTKLFTTHAPRKGTDRSATLTLDYGSGGTISDYTYNEDGAQTETKTTYFGDGDGPDREEGVAIDASSLDGLILEGVYQAAPSTPIDTLPVLATDRLTRSKRLVKLPEITTIQREDLIGTLKTGDVVKVLIDDGWTQIPSLAYRIIRKKLNARDDTLSLTFNEE